MNEVFTVYLSRNDYPGEAHTFLTLPAQPYALEDALDKVRPKENEELYVQIESYHRCGFLSSLPLSPPRLHDLNVLAGKLSDMDQEALMKFEGLAKITTEGQSSVHLQSLVDIACSTSAAEIIPASSDEELGRYCVEKGLLPSFQNLPEIVTEMLDYDKIGFVRRCLETGTFLDDGGPYVRKTGDIQQFAFNMDAEPPKPDYTVLLQVNVPAHDTPLPLKLPAQLAQIDSALDHMPAVSWECVDCRVPALRKLLSEAQSLDVVRETAAVLAAIPEKSLPTYKALLEAEDFYSLGEALRMLETLDEYLLTPQLSSPEEFAEDTFKVILNEQDRETLMPFVDLRSYGETLMREQNVTLTEYGVFERKSGQPIQGQKEENTPSQDGMMMGGF